MKNKEFYKLLKKNKSKHNSGFTLTELLVGLIMSIFVIGALGFGLMQILRVTQKGNSETAARNESSRALDFISDEMRRAQSIEVDMETGAGKNINVIAPNYSLPTGGTVRLALNISDTTQPVIYSVAPPRNTSPWKGPLVIYRWGPVLGADGSYTTASLADPTAWTNEALVDGISDVDQTTTCDNNGDGTAETITYKGFFACVVDDDGDIILDAAGSQVLDSSGNPIKENVTDTSGDGVISFKDDPNDRNGDGKINFGDTLTDTNGDGEITFADSALDINRDGVINAEDGADTDGLAITAQLYFTGETKEADGVTTNTYSADSKTVARSRTAPDNNADDFGGYTTSYRTLEPNFACDASVDWTMRTDFGDNLGNPSNVDKWNYKANRQPQPIVTDTDTLMISSVPISNGSINSSTTCLNRRTGNGYSNTADEQDFEGNKGLNETDDWHSNDSTNNVVAITHAINFDDPRTFNGDPNTCTSYPCTDTTKGRVYTQRDGKVAIHNPYVLVLKNGSTLPVLKGYDIDGDGNYEQDSLGEFLAKKGLAELVSGEVNTGTYKIKDEALRNDERIVAFEVGKSNVSDLNTPGVDFQDNIFILQSDAFKQKYKTYSDYGSDPNNLPDYTGTEQNS